MKLPNRTQYDTSSNAENTAGNTSHKFYATKSFIFIFLQANSWSLS